MEYLENLSTRIVVPAAVTVSFDTLLGDLINIIR
jgi:hypothetical protein